MLNQREIPVGIRTRNLQFCKEVPQQTAPPRALLQNLKHIFTKISRLSAKKNPKYNSYTAQNLNP
jgi:hypothetical protein